MLLCCNNTSELSILQHFDLTESFSKQIMVCFTVDDSSSGYTNFQDWAFTVLEEQEHQFYSLMSYKELI